MLIKISTYFLFLLIIHFPLFSITIELSNGKSFSGDIISEDKDYIVINIGSSDIEILKKMIVRVDSTDNIMNRSVKSNEKEQLDFGKNVLEKNPSISNNGGEQIKDKIKLVNCGPCVVIEKMVIDSSQIGFTIDKEQQLIPSIYLLKAISDCFKCEVIVAPSEQIEKSKHCNAIIARPKLISYIENAVSYGRIKGIINFTLYFFDNALSNKIIAKTTVKGFGEEEYGRDEPFLNAMKEACNIIEDRLCDSDFISSLNF